MSTDGELSGPLRIDEVEAPGGAVLGMVHMPGRNHLDARGRRWIRNLADDVAHIVTWAPAYVVSLNEAHEFPKLGVPEYAETMQGGTFIWAHLPVPDMQPPADAFKIAWATHGKGILRTLGDGGRMLFHCAGGLGRTGTLVARLLVETGIDPADAIALVRASRPGAIETREQEAFVHAARPLAGRS